MLTRQWNGHGIAPHPPPASRSRIARLLGDDGAPADRFAESFPDAKNVRDVLEHIDDYVTGAGRLSDQVKDPRVIVPTVYLDGRDDPTGELFVYVGDWKLPVRAAGREAIAAAELTERIGRELLEKMD